MTFSIVGFDPNTGDLGVAVQSKFICVGQVVPWAEAKIGAVATQAYANTLFGSLGLSMLKQGFSVDEILRKLLANDPLREQRQVGIIDSHGNSAAFTGKECFSYAGHIIGQNFACQGNILTGPDTIEGMVKAFEGTKGDLAEKLLAALHGADLPGRGDARGKQSAALLVVREKGGYGEYTDRYIEIRVDEHPEPIQELHRIFRLYDMTFLTRENPANLIPIQGEVARNIRQILRELGYLPHISGKASQKQNEAWGDADAKALEAWVGINNFENKWRKDGMIWRSVYDYLRNKKGTPMITLKKMSEIK